MSDSSSAPPLCPKCKDPWVQVERINEEWFCRNCSHAWEGEGMRTLKLSLVLVVLGLQMPGYAQQAVSRGPDWVSYPMAAVNPTIALVKAVRSDSPWCHVAQLGISELVGNGTTLTLKHFIRSERPCLGCPPDGFPSGHTMNSVIGVSAGWQIGMTFPVGTAGLRMAAHRHTPWQVLAGAAVGLGAEGAGHLLKCKE